MSYQEPHDKFKKVKLVGKDYKGFKGSFDSAGDKPIRVPKYRKLLGFASSQDACGMLVFDTRRKIDLFKENLTHIIYNPVNRSVVIEQNEKTLWRNKKLDACVFDTNGVEQQKKLAIYLKNKLGLSPERLASMHHEAQYVTDGRGRGLDADYLKNVLDFLKVCSGQISTEKPTI